MTLSRGNKVGKLNEYGLLAEGESHIEYEVVYVGHTQGVGDDKPAGDLAGEQLVLALLRLIR